MLRHGRCLGLALLSLLTLAGCRPPDRGVGLYIAHPGDWGGNMIGIYDGTFSDVDRNIRIRTAPFVGHALVANLEYPTSGAKNADLEHLLTAQVEFVITYLDDNPSASVTLTGFSQGGCLVLDAVTRVAVRRPELLGRLSAALVAPARGVRLGRTTTVAKHMIARCAAAEDWLVAQLEATPSGPVAALITERTWIAWSCTDEIVGHDTFTHLHEYISDEHLLYRARLRHVQWTAKDQDPSREGEIYLASEIALAVSLGLDPRDALAPYGGFDPACD